MMGWRVGYIAYPSPGPLGEQLLKAQDTIAICAPQLSQHLALACLRSGRGYLQQRIASLAGIPLMPPSPSFG
jgi:aspartate/methionine/tyrosine aminotransferase